MDHALRRVPLQGSQLDGEAAARGTTVYLTDRRLDMLPALLSEHLCRCCAGNPNPNPVLEDNMPVASVCAGACRGSAQEDTVSATVRIRNK